MNSGLKTQAAKPTGSRIAGSLELSLDLRSRLYLNMQVDGQVTLEEERLPP